jgi:hypothetical protein
MPQDRGDTQKKVPGGIGAQLGQAMGSAMSGQQQQAGGQPPVDRAAEERAQLTQRASSLGSRLSSARSKATLADLRGSLGRLDSLLSNMPAAIEAVRRGGYLYKGFLEKKAEVLREQWQGLRTRIDNEAAQQGRQLSAEADRLQARLSAMGANLSAATLDALERDIVSLEGKVQGVASALDSRFETIEQNAQQTNRQIDGIKALLERIASATFQLRQGENAIEMVGAQYLTDGEKEGPKGFLFVTDQRLLFEQNEKVATKKFLFITTESERVQKLLIDVPVGGVERAAPSERGGFLSKKEILECSFVNADLSRAVFKLDTDSDDWAALIGRVRTGDIAGEHVGAAAPAPGADGVPAPVPPAAAAPPALPTKCPTCGATLPELMRGQLSLTCDYCGTVVR